MYGVLESMGYPRTDNCVVNASAGRPLEGIGDGDDTGDGSGGKMGIGKMSMKGKQMMMRDLVHERRMSAHAPLGDIRGNKNLMRKKVIISR